MRHPLLVRAAALATLLGAFALGCGRAGEVATAGIKVEGAANQTVTFSGKATPDPRTRTDSVHISYEVPGAYTELKVQVTPVTGPASTYYSTHNWAGAYGGVGLQRGLAGVTVRAGDRDGLERLCRDGATHLVMTHI